METLKIVHLSDIHVRTAADLVLQHGRAIGRCIASNSPDAETLIVVSGDLAFGGTKGEYDLVRQLLTDILAGIAENQNTQPVVHWVLVPGNHDCDFGSTADQMTRKALLSGISSFSPQDRRSVVPALLLPQTEFRNFCSNMGSALGNVYSVDGESTSCQHVLRLRSGVTIGLCLVNSATYSSRNESPGKLEIDSVEPVSADISIVVLHHHWQWLQPSASAAFRRSVCDWADIVMSGHEHSSFVSVFGSQLGDGCWSYEGGALQPHGGQNGEFSILEVDVAQRVVQASRYQVSARRDAEFQRIHRGENLQLRERATSRLLPVPQFRRYLDSLGTGFSHPKRDKLQLDDVFCWPMLQPADVAGTSKRRQANEIVRHLLDSKQDQLWVLGEDSSGRTTLAKRLTQYCIEQKRVCVLLLVDQFPKQLSDVANAVRSEIARQYGQGEVDNVLALPLERRVLILDDLQEVKLPPNRREQLISELRKYFGKTICFSDPVAEAISVNVDKNNEARESFERIRSFYRILPFGHGATAELVTKWLSIGGRELDDDNFHFAVDQTRNRLLGLLDRSMVPSYPFFLLFMLQQLSVMQSERDDVKMAIADDTIAEMYERLIFPRVNGILLHQGLQQKTKVLSLIAGTMFQSRVEFLYREQVVGVIDEYARQHDATIDANQWIDAFVRGGVLCVRDESLEFVYPYIYYYYTAKSILADSVERSRSVASLVASIHTSASASILVFMASDSAMRQPIVDAVCSLIDTLYPNHQALGLEEFETAQKKVAAGKMKDSAPPQIGHSGHDLGEWLVTPESRAQLLEAWDFDVADGALTDEEKRLMEETLRIGASLKALRVLGQLLRSYHSEINASDRSRILGSCLLLSKKLLGLASDTFRMSETALVEYLKYRMREDAISADRIPERAYRTYAGLWDWFAVSIVRRLVNTVGSEHLRMSVEKRYAQSASMTELVVALGYDLSVVQRFPLQKIEVLKEKTKGMGLTRRVVGYLIAERLALRPPVPAVEAKVREWFELQRRKELPTRPA